MPRAVTAESATRTSTHLTRVGTLAAWLALASFFFYLRRNEILMLGDTVAHINIARRVFDSLNPGPLQLGTVWLPLPHLLMIPFLVSDKLWQSGIGGSIPSMIAYVLGVVGIFRLTSTLLNAAARTQAAAQTGAFVAAGVFALNPNLLYVQATALTEPVYLAFFVWAAVFLAEFLMRRDSGFSVTDRQSLAADAASGAGDLRTSLRRCSYCVACAELTRYDGWFLACIIGLFVTLMAIRRWNDRWVGPAALKFLATVALASVLWFVYNAVVYGDALYFANGPYSAKAIAARIAAPNPAAHNLWAAASYFLKSAQLNVAVGNWGRLWLLAAAAATLLLVREARRQGSGAIAVALWSPLAFYALSIAYGSVVLHIPPWWPFAIFNQRFGLELLPLFAVSAGILIASALAGRLAAHAWKIVAAAAALVVASYAFVWIAKPLCWQEAWLNWESRRSLDTAVERAIKPLPPGSRFLMDTSEHVGIMERLGIPLRRVINNEDHRAWVRPSDPEGNWERALANPGLFVNYVIVFDGDLVDKGGNRTGLTLLEVIHALGQPAARVYQTSLPPNQSR